MLRALAALVLAVLSAAAAHASGGISCEAEDKTVKFQAQAGVNSLGAAFFDFKASLEILAPGAPKDFRKLAFNNDHLTQRWVGGRNIKLRLYRERAGEPHGYVDLIIETWSRKDDELEYRGTYLLDIFDVTKDAPDGKTITLKGRVTCEVLG